MRLSNAIKLSSVIRLNNAISLSNIIRLNDIIRLSNAIRLRAGQQRKDLRLLGHYKRVIIINKWLPFRAAIGQEGKILFCSWERLYIYNISGYIITVCSVKRFNIKITFYRSGFSKLF